MTNFTIQFTYPWLLLLILPAIGIALIPYFRIAKKYRRTRNRVLSIVFHCVAITLSILLLSGMTFHYDINNNRNELILLVDSSDSGLSSVSQKEQYVQEILDLGGDEYQIGIVKFGYDQVYAAPLSLDAEKTMERYLSSDDPDPSATDLASALTYASGLFSYPETAKIVVISDGIETDGTATGVIKAISARGISVDTLCLENVASNEMQIVEVTLPDYTVMPGVAFTVDVTAIHNQDAPFELNTLRVLDGDKQIAQKTFFFDAQRQTIDIELTLEGGGMHELSFEMMCGASEDTLTQNNRYISYVNLEQFENVLVLERKEGESAALRQLMTDNDYKVTHLSFETDLDEMPRSVNDLCEYEQIVLVNVAYGDMKLVTGLEEMLHEYVYELGGGLFTVGGENDTDGDRIIPHAYNRADMEQSKFYKQMLPVITTDYTPPIAVMIVIDTSGSMSMGKLDEAKEGALACLDSLQDRDFCGVTSFASRSIEEVSVMPVSRKDEIRNAIGAIGYDEGSNSSSGSGGTIFSSAIQLAGRALGTVDVERRHIILVTDGDPGDSIDDYGPYIDKNVEDEITMSIITVGADEYKSEKMQIAAERGNGAHYNVTADKLNQKDISVIMQQDIAMEAVAEIAYGEPFSLKIKDHSTVVEGIAEESIPQLTGYYGTVAREDAIVALMGKYVPIYAQHRYGAGNVGSFLSDLNGTWSADFMADTVGQTIVLNIIRGLFPMQDVQPQTLDIMFKEDNYRTQVNVYGAEDDERIELTVTPLALAGAVVESVEPVMQERNRRYTYELLAPGVYEIVIVCLDAGGTPLSRNVFYQTFSYSKEYNITSDRELIGPELMERLAVDGNGAVVEQTIAVFDGFNKHLHRSYDPRILYLILTIVLVLLDIAVRKFKFKWPHEIIRERRERKAEEQNKQ